jgi:hypothetical protein
MNCHASQKLDSLIGKQVTIIFWDGIKKTGILAYPSFGNGYLLVTKNSRERFYKSHVKRILKAESEDKE